MLHINCHVGLYTRGIRPEIHYAVVRYIVDDAVTLSDGVNTFLVSRNDIAKQGDKFWLMS